MRKAARACLRMHESGEGLALPAIVAVCGTTLVLEVCFLCIGSGPTVRPYEWHLNYWLFLVLGASYAVWSFLRARGVAEPAAGLWFILAAYGLWMRTYCFMLLFEMNETYGGRSVLEDAADADGRFLIAVHRYGGLFAFALGLGMVAWCSRRLSPRAGREGPLPARGSSAAARAARARPEDVPPS